MLRIKRTLVHIANHPGRLFLTFAIELTIAGLLYSIIENKSVSDGVWWAVVTAGTVGYGDQFPVTEPGRLIGHFVILFNIFLIAPCIIAAVLNLVMKDRDKFTHEEQERLMADLQNTRECLALVLQKLDAVLTEVDDVEEANSREVERDERLHTMITTRDDQLITAIEGINQRMDKFMPAQNGSTT